MKMLAALILTALISSSVFAEKLGSNHQVGQQSGDQAGDDKLSEGGQSGQQGKRRGPPPEALAACKGKSLGTGCSFQSPRGDNVSGTCFAPKSDLPLGCRPAGRDEVSK